MTKHFAWRSMSAVDLIDVEEIAAMVHPGFFEEPAVFAERLALYPKGARLLEIGNRPAGYVFAHPWRLGALPALNTLLHELPQDADTFYIHDLALLPHARGTGAAAEVVEMLAGHAREVGLPTLSLVAVNGSAGFWERQGFAPRTVPSLGEKLRSYEEAARFMALDLALPA